MSERHLILLVEESDNSLGFYDSHDGSPSGRIKVGLWPHEVTVSPDGQTAYVTNFGLRDYDLTIGHAGNSISVIDIANRCEVHRLYTCNDEFRYWGPHGVRLSPDGKHLYVNVERVVGLRGPDPTAGPGQEQTSMLVFDVATRELVNSFALPVIRQETRLSDKFLFPVEDPVYSYGVPRGSHNFVFSPDGKDLWIFSGRGGISRLNPRTGEITAHLTDFNGAVRGLAYTNSGHLLVSATNEISLVDPATLSITRKIGDLGVTQLLYSQATPDTKYALAPAVWEGQVLVIDLEAERIVKRITTGVDPVHIIIAPGGESAYVTHGRSNWAAEIAFDNFEVRRLIQTQGGPNGVDVAPWSEQPERRTLTFGACLPFTGEDAVEGREMRLGYAFWQDQTNEGGGIVVDGKAHRVEIVYANTESKTDEPSVRRLTEQLIKEQGAQFLLGSYPSLSNLHVGSVANENRIPFVTATGNIEELYDKGLEYVFGIMTLGGADLYGAISALWRHLSPKPQTIAILSCDENLMLREARSMAQFSREKGLDILHPAAPTGPHRVDASGVIVYPHLTTDFDSIIRDLQELTPDLLVNVGHRLEGVGITESSQELRFTPGALAFSFGITIPGFRAQFKDAAQNLFGSVQWSEMLDNCGHDRFVTAQDFSRNYFTEFSEKPSYLAAGAVASGVILEKAIGSENTADPERVRDALRKTDRPTFYGHVTFNKEGLNIAKPIITVQLRRVGEEVGEVVLWPPEESGRNRPVWPFPGWPDNK